MTALYRFGKYSENNRTMWRERIVMLYIQLKLHKQIEYNNIRKQTIDVINIVITL